MSKINALYVGRTEFLEKLTLDCETIGAGKNLGELKSYVLLQALNMKFGQRVCVFCSDDKMPEMELLRWEELTVLVFYPLL